MVGQKPEAENRRSNIICAPVSSAWARVFSALMWKQRQGRAEHVVGLDLQQGGGVVAPPVVLGVRADDAFRWAGSCQRCKARRTDLPAIPVRLRRGRRGRETVRPGWGRWGHRPPPTVAGQAAGCFPDARDRCGRSPAGGRRCRAGNSRSADPLPRCSAAPGWRQSSRSPAPVPAIRECCRTAPQLGRLAGCRPGAGCRRGARRCLGPAGRVQVWSPTVTSGRSPNRSAWRVSRVGKVRSRGGRVVIVIGPVARTRTGPRARLYSSMTPPRSPFATASARLVASSLLNKASR